MNNSKNRQGAMTVVAAAVLVSLLIGVGVMVANQVGATHRTLHWLEQNRRLEATADNAIEEALARFCAKPPPEDDLGPVAVPVMAQAVASANPDLELGPVALTTSALEAQPDDTALGILTAKVRVSMPGGRHLRGRTVEVRRYVMVSPDSTKQGAIVQVGVTDLRREVGE